MKNRIRLAATIIGLLLITGFFAGLSAASANGTEIPTPTSVSTTTIEPHPRPVCPEGQRPIGQHPDGSTDCVNDENYVSTTTTSEVVSDPVVAAAANVVTVAPSFTG